MPNTTEMVKNPPASGKSNNNNSIDIVKGINAEQRNFSSTSVAKMTSFRLLILALRKVSIQSHCDFF